MNNSSTHLCNFHDQPNHYKSDTLDMTTSSIVSYVDGYYLLERPIKIKLNHGDLVNCYMTAAPALTFWTLTIDDVATINSIMFDMVTRMGCMGFIKYLDVNEYNFFAIDESTDIHYVTNKNPIQRLKVNGITAKVTLKLMGFVNKLVEIKPMIHAEKVVIYRAEDDEGISHNT